MFGFRCLVADFYRLVGIIDGIKKMLWIKVIQELRF